MAIKVAVPSWSLDPEYGKPDLSDYHQLFGLDKDRVPLFSAPARQNLLSASMPVSIHESGGGLL